MGFVRIKITSEDSRKNEVCLDRKSMTPELSDLEIQYDKLLCILYHVYRGTRHQLNAWQKFRLVRNCWVSLV